MRTISAVRGASRGAESPGALGWEGGLRRGVCGVEDDATPDRHTKPAARHLRNLKAASQRPGNVNREG
jgi:hypothetical protein